MAQIAKVREKVSDGSQEFENIEDALEEIPEETISESMENMEDTAENEEV